jgi:hypothetical protein
LAELLKAAERPLLRLSPLLSGEAIDRFLSFARKRSLPVSAWGLESLETEWGALLPPDGNGASPQGYLFSDRSRDEERRVLLILGNLDQSNNVAFTECLALARRQPVRLWHLGAGEGALAAIYRRFFDRVGEQLELLPGWLDEAAADHSSGSLEVLLNPEECFRLWGKAAERALLGALTEPAAPAVLADRGSRERSSGKGSASVREHSFRVTLFWNSRNGGYLLPRLAAAGLLGAPATPDLLLEAGPAPLIGEPQGVPGRESPGVAGRESPAVRRVRWGDAPAGETLFVPLARVFLLSGSSIPSGRPPLRIGTPTQEELDQLLLG